jgi:hypothetical protein
MLIKRSGTSPWIGLQARAYAPRMLGATFGASNSVCWVQGPAGRHRFAEKVVMNGVRRGTAVAGVSEAK